MSIAIKSTLHQNVNLLNEKIFIEVNSNVFVEVFLAMILHILITYHLKSILINLLVILKDLIHGLRL